MNGKYIYLRHYKRAKTKKYRYKRREESQVKETENIFNKLYQRKIFKFKESNYYQSVTRVHNTKKTRTEKKLFV